jgi:hypothetical protein
VRASDRHASGGVFLLEVLVLRKWVYCELEFLKCFGSEDVLVILLHPLTLTCGGELMTSVCTILSGPAL